MWFKEVNGPLIQLVNQNVHPSITFNLLSLPVSQYHLSKLLSTLDTVPNIFVCIIFGIYVRILGIYSQDKIAEG